MDEKASEFGYGDDTGYGREDTRNDCSGREEMPEQRQVVRTHGPVMGQSGWSVEERRGK